VKPEDIDGEYIAKNFDIDKERRTIQERIDSVDLFDEDLDGLKFLEFVEEVKRKILEKGGTLEASRFKAELWYESSSAEILVIKRREETDGECILRLMTAEKTRLAKEILEKKRAQKKKERDLKEYKRLQEEYQL
jgi:hypothetical protein